MARPEKAGKARRASTADPAQDVGAEGIDTVLDGLEEVVRQLEGGDLPLEEALARFEHGVALARRGGKMLDAVEERVERLLVDRDETVAFDPRGSEDTEDDR
jgi:exodeoxyribonuclease VII small subunit